MWANISLIIRTSDFRSRMFKCACNRLAYRITHQMPNMKFFEGVWVSIFNHYLFAFIETVTPPFFFVRGVHDPLNGIARKGKVDEPCAGNIRSEERRVGKG